MSDTFKDLSLDWLRSKPGIKWSDTGTDVIPAWIADMDFPPPPCVLQAIEHVIASGDLGYPEWLEATPLAEPFAERMHTRFSWSPDPGRVHQFTDILNAFAAVLSLTALPGDAIVVHGPTYPPFLKACSRMGLEIRELPLQRVDNSWRFDADRLSVAVDGARLLLVVNPHNPTGKVFDRAELETLAEAALRAGALIVSDEVHADIVYQPHSHVPMAALSDEVAANTVTFQSASKSFNLAGMCCATAWVGEKALHERLMGLPHRLFGAVGNLGVASTLAAWSDGDEWLTSVMRRLDRNRHIIAEFLSQEVPGLRYIMPEATYLAWLDFIECGLGDDPAVVLHQVGRLKLSTGPDFGPQGRGFARLNFATSENVLVQILRRIEATVNRTADGRQTEAPSPGLGASPM